MGKDADAWFKKGFLVRNGVLTPIKPASAAPLPLCPSNRPISDAGRLILPYPPSVNRLYGINPHPGRRYLGKEGKEFCHEVRRIAVAAGVRPLSCDVVFFVYAFRPRKCGDLSNLFKNLEDSLEGILYDNDRQIVEHHAYRYDDKDNPRVEVVVRPA
jgi:Holliday junction resolvase RusA-like endonuclease